MKYCSKFRKASAGVRAVISAELAAMQSTVLLTKGGFASRGQEDPVGLVWVGFFVHLCGTLQTWLHTGL